MNAFPPTLAALLALCLTAFAAPPDPADAFERQVLEEMLAEPAGTAQVRDLALPDPLLRRIADRRIRDAFHQQIHLVRADAQTAQQLRGNPPIDPHADPSAPYPFVVLPGPATDHRAAAAWREFLSAHPTAHPTRRGLLVPAFHADTPELPPFDPTDPLTDLVARHLATDGLARSIVRAVLHLQEHGNLPPDSAAFRARLEAVGFPVDLSDRLRREGDTEPSPIYDEVLSALRDPAASDASESALAAELHRRATDFTIDWDDLSHFRAAAECGKHDVERIRLQLTRGTDWSAPTDGGAIDVLRQFHRLLPDVLIDAALETRFLPSFGLTAHAWPNANRIRIIPAQDTLSQWLRDHAVIGFLHRKDAPPARATLVPRYGSRGEPGSALIGGDTIAARVGLVPGEEIIVAPLLFQGGNVLSVHDPASNRRVLFIGEAELYRNRTLGLSKPEVLRGFARVFGADDVRVLSGPSFHIDFDVSIRSTADRMVAFVHDVDAGAAIVLRCGIDALERGGILSAAQARQARRAIDRGDSLSLGEAIGPPVYGKALPEGGFPWSLAEVFSAGRGDSGIGNFQRFLLAADRFHVRSGGDSILPADPGVRTYYRAILRAKQDEAELERQLRAAGCIVVPVPGFSEGGRSLSPVNALHARGFLLMPAAGGLFSPLDDAAADTFRRTLGPAVTVIPITCGESLRRSGGLHCAAILIPAKEKN